MKIALLMGSFDPPHIGHIMLMKYVDTSYKFDNIWMLPIWENPWKENQTDFPLRLKMCKQAVSGLPYKVVSIAKQVKSPYAVDYLKALLKKYKDIEITLIFTNETYNEFPKWKDYEWIKDNFKFLVIDTFNLIKFGVPPVHSTAIRNMIKNGDNPIPYVNKAIYTEILFYNLYRE